tara:strand:+ start:378 stop:3479 length:3102 start_codon:yes stop_codon:yes gene_type:complete
MTTQVNNSTFLGLENLLDGATSITKDTTIKLDADVTKTKKTPLTYEQMKEILETGGSISEGSTLPTSLSMKQYASLPGGLSAYQNLQGMGMMEAIKGTAGFGTGPGGIDTDPNEPSEETPPQVIAHNCPEGYVFDSNRQMCVIEPKEEEGPQYDDTQSSYNSFVEMVIASPDFDGTMESFTNNANNSWLGENWTTFYNDDSMLSNSFNEFVGPDMIYGGGVPIGSTGGVGVDFEGNPTVAGESKPPSEGPFQVIEDVIPKPEEPKPTDLGSAFDSNFQPTQSEDYYNYPDEDRPAGGETSFENVNSGGGDDFGYSGGFDLNTGGFVEQTKPLQLDDVSLKMQEGGQIPVEQPMEGMPVPSGQPAGFIEDPSAAPAPDTPMDAMQGEGQKDDVMGELPEGTFVINAMAVQLAGIDELDKMVEEAYEALVENLKEKGVEVPLIQQLVDRSRSIGKVDVAVSNGEYIIPPELVPIIGEDRLRKINDRGLRKLEETKKTREKQQAPSQMKEGGFAIATDPDGKILTEKVKDESGREVSRILAKNEVVSPEDKGQPSDVSTKDINKSKSFVRRVTPDEMAAADLKRKADLKRRQEKEGMKLSGPDTPTTDYIVRSEDPEELRDAATYTERQDPEELRDAATYAERQDPEELRNAAIGAETQPMKKQTKGFVQPQLNVSEASRLGVTKPEYQDPEELRDAATYSNKPAGNISLDNALEHIQGLYDNGDYSGLLNIMIDQDGTFFNFPEGAKARARDLAQQLLANKKSSAAKKLLDSSINDEVKAQGMMVGSGLFDETGKRRTEPVNNTTPSSQDFNTKSDEDKQNIIKNFLKNKLNISAPANNKFGVKALPVSMMQEPRNADNIFTREGDFPEKIDPNDNVALNQLFLRVLEKETIGLDDKAVSPKGAIGLSQLMPDTIKDPGSGLIALLPESERQFLDPRIVGDAPLTDNNANLLFGTFYLKSLLLYYKGDVAKALGAYNDGFGDTNDLIKEYGEKWVDNAPKETRDYILTIKGYLRPAPDIPLPKAKPKQSRVGGFV